MKCFVISLSDREDRRLEFFSSEYIRELNPVVIDAVNTKDEIHTTHPNLAVAACWMSHVKFAQAFLDTEEEFAVVFEDDAQLTEEGFELIYGLRDGDLSNIDCIQIGFNTFDGRITGRRRLLVDQIWAHTLHFIKSVMPFKVNPSRTIKLFNQLLVRGSFETGTHCYLVSRKLARLIINFNLPVIVPADVALGELALCPNLNFYRSTTSLCNQSNSPSSIECGKQGR